MYLIFPSVSGKAISIAYSECVLVTLVTQHAMRMHHFVICGLLGTVTFFHLISQKARFSKKKKLLNINCVFWFYMQSLSEIFLIMKCFRQRKGELREI